MTTTTDGRALTQDDFRPIPGFDKYRITSDGDVMNVRTGRLLREYENPTTGAYSYTLWKDGGGKTSRNYLGLVEAAWGGADVTRGAVGAGGAVVASVDGGGVRGAENGAERGEA